MKKRIIALLLALVMIVGMLPAGLAVEANNEAGFTYNFMRLRYGQWSSDGYHPSHPFTSIPCKNRINNTIPTTPNRTPTNSAAFDEVKSFTSSQSSMLPFLQIF